jgi:flagellar biogenesis protein FliO
LFEPVSRAEPYAETSRLLWQMLAYVLLILVIGAVGIFLARRVLPRMRAVGGKRIQLVETVYLGPRQTLHLVRVGRKSLLVAGTRERISMLADVTGAFEEAPGRDVSDSPH